MGALVGCNYGTVLHAYADGTAGGNNCVYVGGLVGGNFGGLISRSSASVAVNGCAGGGLVGRNGGTILGSLATGDVDAGSAGGLVAANGTRHYHLAGQILLSHATGRVSSSGGGGGLADLNIAGSNIDQSYATGAVSADACAGGLVGCFGFKEYGSGSISDSYATGPVSGVSFAAGGLQGNKTISGATITSYSVGAVTGGSNCVGGFLACARSKAREELQNDYWDVDTSGTNVPCGLRNGHPVKCAGVMGLTDTQLKSGLPNGFNPTIWGQSPNIYNGYPYLLANPPQ